MEQLVWWCTHNREVLYVCGGIVFFFFLFVGGFIYAVSQNLAELPCICAFYFHISVLRFKLMWERSVLVHLVRDFARAILQLWPPLKKAIVALL